ncbi:hypothetical protein UFOVP93_39 [uncultured Caudovirales phage]|uniref:Uncharacterized protein n=1 Tax=uncultured Caudovirales phage TaxID=2100421 RepID=A0A6J5L014_9CAUD|nr:hypothetical protein UFOVP93_39 [uncultured Caudovirales phage]
MKRQNCTRNTRKRIKENNHSYTHPQLLAIILQLRRGFSSITRRGNRMITKKILKRIFKKLINFCNLPLFFYVLLGMSYLLLIMALMIMILSDSRTISFSDSFSENIFISPMKQKTKDVHTERVSGFYSRLLSPQEPLGKEF